MILGGYIIVHDFIGCYMIWYYLYGCYVILHDCLILYDFIYLYMVLWGVCDWCMMLCDFIGYRVHLYNKCVWFLNYVSGCYMMFHDLKWLYVILCDVTYFLICHYISCYFYWCWCVLLSISWFNVVYLILHDWNVPLSARQPSEHDS